MRSNAIAQLTLKFDAVFCRCSAAAACFLQITAKILKEVDVIRQAVNHGDCLSAAPLLLHPHLRDDAIRDKLFTFSKRLAALAVIDRPPALRADAASGRGVNELRVRHYLESNRTFVKNLREEPS